MTFETFIESNFYHSSSIMPSDIEKLRVAFAEVEAARVVEQQYSQLFLYHHVSKEKLDEVGMVRVQKQNDLDALIKDVKSSILDSSGRGR